MATRAELDQFVDLWCADPLLLRQEFDDIIAAEFTRPTHPRPQRSTNLGPSPGGAPHRPPADLERLRYRQWFSTTRRSAERAPPS